ncbi:hypothetical protein PVL29_025103 [Vitis rotundifolia]|uniref:Uncharacterized protein n=1 Tax=Vitis rotundifolia TaxID=103349 RepID=A0AA38YTI8_VITRO|nr:hypothetical protein PVL29_025103 [Vitis rotundifolia]
MDGMEKTRRKLKGESMTMSVETSVDWRGRPCKANKHGGMAAAIFVLGLQAFEMMAIAAVGNNLITYVFNDMHFPLSKSANIVTNFIGTVFLLSLLGGFLSDSYLGSFWTMLIFGFVELSGFILLSVQAHLPQLRPPHCNMVLDGDNCSEAKGYKALIFFLALYLVALGSGCLKPNIISHGADQFRKEDSKQSKKLSSYFNAAYFAFCMGELVALTVLVWVQTHSGMDVGFGVSAAAMAMGLISLISGTLVYMNKPPRGSIFTPIAQVFVRCNHQEKANLTSNSGMHTMESQLPEQRFVLTNDRNLLHTEKFRTLESHLSKGLSLDSLLQPVPWFQAATGREKEENFCIDSNRILSIFWIAPQFSSSIGLTEMFTAVGLIEFFYKQSPVLDLFYWLLAALSLLNFINYLFCLDEDLEKSQPSTLSSKQIAADNNIP